MIPGIEMLACQDLAVPLEVMQHVVSVESSFNPYAIGVVGARLARQPRSLEEAVATATQLEREGYNFSLGLAQVNRYNLAAQGLDDYGTAFSTCPNLAAGARILADCRSRAGGDWGKAFSCYYSGNFERGFRDGYVQKVHASMQAAGLDPGVAPAIPINTDVAPWTSSPPVASLRKRRGGARAPAGVAQASSVPDPRRDAQARPPGIPPPHPPEGPFVPRVSGPTRSLDLTPGLPAGAQGPPHDQHQADSAFVF